MPWRDLVFDPDSLVVTRGDRRIELTAKELAILELLMSRRGKVVSRQRILSGLWRQHADPLTNVVDVYIARLRKKIDRPGEPELISTIRGYGYRHLVLDSGSSGRERTGRGQLRDCQDDRDPLFGSHCILHDGSARA